ncbi:unnamed protein product [Clonostachys byssicola]|uniref:Uncharacterized protein n=1 Tax=Clonostachys byssicola TaxID=160290 RepID=A0A9N9XY32_9HYPO|nr:unnamed protein product [Clonostachys byssicola]
MHLPAEIISKIVEELINVPETEFHPFDDDWFTSRRVLWEDVICTNHYDHHRINIGQEALALRLISREWNQWVTAMMQEHFTWKVDIGSADSLRKALICLPEPNEGCAQGNGLLPTREIVRRLVVNPGKETRDISVGDQPKKWNIKDLLLQLFRRLGHVEDFALHFPRGNSNDPDVANSIVEAVAHCFQQTNSSSRITSLQLKVPSTYHAAQAFQAILPDKPAKIRNLLVEILDSSGKSGSRDYLEKSYMEDEDIDGTAEESGDDEPALDYNSSFDRSPLQRIYPNRRHQQELWECITECKHLQALSIQGTHYLNLRRLHWPAAPNFTDLRVLHLGRLYSGVTPIQKLIKREGRPASLQKLIIDDVKMPLDEGIWGAVLQFLLDECPNLELLFVYNLSYFQDVGRWAGLSSPEDGTVIDSSERDDEEPLKELIHMFADKFGSSDTWPYWLREMCQDLDIMEDYQKK